MQFVVWEHKFCDYTPMCSPIQSESWVPYAPLWLLQQNTVNNDNNSYDNLNLYSPFQNTQGALTSERCISELNQNYSWTWTESFQTVLSLSLSFELMSTHVLNNFLSEQSTARPWTWCALSRRWHHWFSQCGRAYSIPWGEWFSPFNLNLFGNVGSWHVCRSLEIRTWCSTCLTHLSVIICISTVRICMCIVSTISVNALLWIKFYVSVYRAPLLSSTAVLRNQKPIWVRGESEHVRHVRSELVCPRGKAQTGGPVTPQVNACVCNVLDTQTNISVSAEKHCAILTQYFLDETDTSYKPRESDSEDEQPTPKMVCSPPTSQRVPIFPGLSPAALIVSSQSSSIYIM